MPRPVYSICRESGGWIHCAAVEDRGEEYVLAAWARLPDGTEIYAPLLWRSKRSILEWRRKEIEEEFRHGNYKAVWNMLRCGEGYFLCEAEDRYGNTLDFYIPLRPRLPPGCQCTEAGGGGRYCTCEVDKNELVALRAAYSIADGLPPAYQGYAARWKDGALWHPYVCRKARGERRADLI